MKLRDYQKDIFDQLITSASNDLVQLDTGAGKTPIEAALAEWAPFTLLVAHRNILIQQMSEKLAAFGLDHDTISTEHTRRRCMAAHLPHGRSFIKRGHKSRLVASMQSIVSAIRHNRLNIDTDLPWLIVIDEAHHVLSDNMWGILRDLFPNARFIGFTATPARMDGESLHSARGGMFDQLIQASTLKSDSTRILIERGFLSGFICYAATGAKSARPGLDWSRGILELAGDPVEEYRIRALGSRAIVMAPAIANAQQISNEFRASGIPSACINSTQSPAEIARILDSFRSGSLLVLTNVDMVGEGFDLPSCETLIIATRTASFPRYRQWCGRVLRPATGKQSATIIDLTGMVALHGVPDQPVDWDLLNPPCGPRTRRHVPCGDCGSFFLFKLDSCPECGWGNAWHDRSSGLAPGSYKFNLRIIDKEYRGLVIRERKQKQYSERMRTELINPPSGFGSDLLGRTISRLAEWLPEQLLVASVPIYDINLFLSSPSARDRSFYMNNFTAADLSKNNSRKAIKVYKQWIEKHKQQ